MNKKLTISATDEKVPFPAAVRGSKTPVLKLSNTTNQGAGFLWQCLGSDSVLCLFIIIPELCVPGQ